MWLGGWVPGFLACFAKLCFQGHVLCCTFSGILANESISKRRDSLAGIREQKLEQETTEGMRTCVPSANKKVSCRCVTKTCDSPGFLSGLFFPRHKSAGETCID